MIKNKLWYIILSWSLVVSICLAFYGRDKYFFIGTIGLVTFWLSAILFIVFVILAISYKINKKERIFALFKYSSIILLISLVLFLAMPIALKLMDHDTKQAKKYCQSLILIIENYKTKYGKYPDSIDGLISKNVNLPLRLKDYDFYTSNGTSFEIVVPLIGPNVSWDMYDSKNNKWEHIDFVGDTGSGLNQ